MVVKDDSAWSFAYIPPSETEVGKKDIELIIPNTLQRGWLESPPFFCASNKAARDVGNKYSTDNTPMQSHLDEDIIMDIE